MGGGRKEPTLILKLPPLLYLSRLRLLRHQTAQEPSAPVASWPGPEGSYTQRMQEQAVEAESQILDCFGFIFRTKRESLSHHKV